MRRADRSALTLLAGALLAALPLQAADLRAPEAAPAVFPLGEAAEAARVARVWVELDGDGLPADGQSPLRVRVRLFGTDGAPVAGRVRVTVEASAGRLLIDGAATDELGPRARDADRAVPGVQLLVQDGDAAFTLLAPSEPQDLRLRVTAGSQVAEGRVRYLPDLRPMVAAGLLEGVVSLRSRLSVTPVRRGDPFEQELQAWSRDFDGGRGQVAARAALYLKGVVKGDWLLTAAYDSDKPTRQRLLRDIRPDDYYPVYGDASLKSADARSLSRLYLRVDQGRSYLLWGDFVSGEPLAVQPGVGRPPQRSLGLLSRAATGLRLHHEGERLSGNAWAFRDTLRQVVEEIASQGSGPYGLRHNAVLEGSEQVEVVVRDRLQPARIVSVQRLSRGSDYQFEPFSGRILLNRFLPSVDEQLNPVSLRIAYEVDQGGPAFWSAGVDGQWQATEQLNLGGSYAQDDNPLAPYRLASGNLGWQLGERTLLVVEGAQSRSTVNTNAANRNASPGLAERSGEVDGRAARIELLHEGETVDLRAYAGRSGAGFNNPSAPLSGGRDELALQTGWRLASDWRLQADALHSADRNPGGGRLRQGGLGLGWQASETLRLELGLRERRETIGRLAQGYLDSPFSAGDGLTSAIGSGAAGGLLGYGQQALDPISGLPLITQSGLRGAPSTLPLGTRLATRSLRLGASWRATPLLRLGAEAEASVDGERLRRAALGADYQVAERTRLHGRWERQSGWVRTQGASELGRRADQFALGVASSYWRDTQLFSEYRLRDAISGDDLQLASGIRQNLEIAEGWRATLGAERSQVIRGDQAATRALSAGLDWSAHPLWRGSLRLESRRSGDLSDTPDTDERFDTALVQGLLARKLDRDWTLLTRWQSLRTDYRARGDILQQRLQLGLAWRDTDRNRSNALFKLERKRERDASNAAVGELSSRAWILSAVADYHPSRPWWLSGRWAGKWQNDVFEGGTRDRFRAQLLAGRVVWDLSERWDASLLTATQLGQRGAREHALGAEVGYLLQTNLWLSAGLNHQGFDGDADLSGYEYTRKGAYLRLRFKFDETLFKSHDRELNRSLPR